MARSINWPKISLVLLTLNGGEGVRRCLKSVKRQVYPRHLIEIIVIDNGSTDKSVEIAKTFTPKVYRSDKNVYINRGDGMRMATGEFVFMTLEQDLELRGRYFLQKMVKPLIEDKRIVASFTKEYPRRNQSWVTRFISYHPCQCDPLYEYLTPPVERSFIEKRRGYILCKFTIGEIAPFSRMLYRVSFLKANPVWKMEKNFDHDTVIGAVKIGYDLFAYVPSAGTYHYHARSLKELLNKRARNLKNHYFPYYDTLKYRWFDITNRNDIFRIIIWIIYANLFFPAGLRGIFRFLKFKDWALLMEPVVTIATTDVILWTFLSNKVGRQILFRAVKTIL